MAFLVMCTRMTVPLLVWCLCCNACACFNVCVLRGIEGFALCDMNTPSMQWTGYEMSAFRWISAQMNWTEAPDWTQLNGNAPNVFAFRCLDQPDWPAVLTNLSLPSTYGDCAAAVGAISVSSLRSKSGVQFTRGWYRASIAAMLYSAPKKESGQWEFLKPFSWDLWVAFLLTLFFVPSMVWFVERLNISGRIPFTRTSVHEWHAATYMTMLSIFNLEVYPVTTVPAQMVVFSFLFMILILVATYTANLAALLTSASDSAVVVSDISSLRGDSVSTLDIYQTRLQQQYGVDTGVPVEWHGQSTIEEVLPQLMNGSLRAFVHDLPLLQYYLNRENYDCALSFVDPTGADDVDYAAAWHVSFPRSLLTTFSRGVVLAQEQALLSTWQTQFISTGDLCSASSLVAEGDASVSLPFSQLRGLWIVLAAATAVSLLWTTWIILGKLREYGLEEVEAQDAYMRALNDPDGALASSPSSEELGKASPMGGSPTSKSPLNSRAPAPPPPFAPGPPTMWSLWRLSGASWCTVLGRVFVSEERLARMLAEQEASELGDYAYSDDEDDARLLEDCTRTNSYINSMAQTYFCDSADGAGAEGGRQQQMVSVGAPKLARSPGSSFGSGAQQPGGSPAPPPPSPPLAPAALPGPFGVPRRAQHLAVTSRPSVGRGPSASDLCRVASRRSASAAALPTPAPRDDASAGVVQARVSVARSP